MKSTRTSQPKPTKNFLNADPRVLRFNAVEIESRNSSSVNITGTSTPKTYGLVYYLSDDSMEVRLLTKTSQDEASVLVKRQRIPLSTRNGTAAASSALHTGAGGVYFQATDLLCGSMIDLYGRKFLILTCDEPTREYYRGDLGIEQREVVVEPAPSRADSKDGMSGRGEMIGASLPIGEREGSNPRGQRMRSELNGVTLRCKCQLLTGDSSSSGGGGEKSSSQQFSRATNPQRPSSATPNFRRGQGSQSYRLPENPPRPSPVATGQWFQPPPPCSRLLLLTYHLEDHTLAINEENPQNSLQTGAGTGQSFLRRNRYVNDLTGQGCGEQEIYLGNELRINGFAMKIVEMDESSCKYCEERCARSGGSGSGSGGSRRGDPTDFIFFNINFVADRILDKVLPSPSLPPFFLLPHSPTGHLPGDGSEGVPQQIR
jgi:hypothetical protein